MKSTLKKALSLALSLTLTISLAACGNSGNILHLPLIQRLPAALQTAVTCPEFI